MDEKVITLRFGIRIPLPKKDLPPFPVSLAEKAEKEVFLCKKN